MGNLGYYTEAAVSSLRDSVHANLDWYYEGLGEMPQPAGVERGTRETYMAHVDLASVLDGGDQTKNRDPRDAVRLHDALRDLKPKDAADERFWVHSCHCDGAAYVRERWLQDRPPRDEHAVRKVHNHFFATGTRALIRDNALSRLWWLGHIARKVAPDDPLLFLEVLMHRQDVRSALIERPFLSMNHEVLRAVYAVMLDHWQQDGRNSDLFNRSVFRGWMIRLNSRGGVVLLDALPAKALDELLRSELDAALDEAARA